MRERRSQPIPPNHVSIGQIVAPHGIKGGMRVTCLTDFPERYEVGKTLFLKGVQHTIREVQWHKDQVRLFLDGISTPEAVELLRWEYLTVPESDLPELDQDEYMAEDLIGLRVVRTTGEELGTVEEVLSAPAQDLLVVQGAMIPMVKEFIKEIDFEEGVIRVQLIYGLAPGEEAEEIR